MSTPLVSIIMPFKNTERYIAECIQSIRLQTEENWELLAVDDHSSDKSKSIVAALSESDSRIKLFENEGSGIIAGLNTAYKASQGQFITRIDSDDLVPKDRLKLQLYTLKTHGKGFITVGKVNYFGEEEIGSGYIAYQEWINGLIDIHSHWDEIYKECVIPSPCWMMHRDDLDACGAFIGEDYPEDYELVFRIWEKGFKVIGINKVLLLWREHAQRTSRNDERLTDWYFSKLKVKYFVRNSLKPNHSLVIWGAGNRAKDLVELFKGHQIALYWISENPEKVGKKIKDIQLIRLAEIPFDQPLQHIISFTNHKSKKHVKSFMNDRGLELNKDYFFFA